MNTLQVMRWSWLTLCVLSVLAIGGCLGRRDPGSSRDELDDAAISTDESVTDPTTDESVADQTTDESVADQTTDESVADQTTDESAADTPFDTPEAEIIDCGRLRVEPNPVDFGRVRTGATKTVAFTVSNTGECDLEVNDLFLTGSAYFEFTIAEEEGVDVEYEPFEPELPFLLEPSESISLSMTFLPWKDGFAEGTLIVRSNDPEDQEVDIPVAANGDQACILVTEESGVDFRQRLIGEDHPRTITITNCSHRADLLLSNVELNEHLELDGLDRYILSSTPDLSTPMTIAPQGSTSVSLTYSPILYTPENRPDDCSNEEGCEIADGSVLVVESNDEVKSPLEIEVRGAGTNNHCPTAVARARIQGTDLWDTQLDSIPLEILEFDGRSSSDPEGGIANYQWEVTNRPEGSTANFAPNSSVPNPTFFLDLVGTFTFQLRVFDEQGTESCDSATILAVATPDSDVYVQLVWNTPGDRNELDTGAGTGSDVDLHFMHPSGTWNTDPWDCYWDNKNPNWGDPSARNDDPRLEIDDTDGAGPEVLHLDNPEGTEAARNQYKVGVFYLNEHGYGTVNATVRIFLDGRERFGLTFLALENQQFWDVARINWPTGDIERVHRLYPSGFP